MIGVIAAFSFGVKMPMRYTNALKKGIRGIRPLPFRPNDFSGMGDFTIPKFHVINFLPKREIFRFEMLILYANVLI